jgi:hypothetical protein
MHMERKVRTIRAQRPTGETVFVDECQELVHDTSLSNPLRQWVPGHKRLELRYVGPVSLVDDRTFEVVATGERLTVT